MLGEEREGERWMREIKEERRREREKERGGDSPVVRKERTKSKRKRKSHRDGGRNKRIVKNRIK